MIRSMTGFGRGECSNEHYKICVEIKSVNHRYLDLNVKMPKKCNPYEAKIRSILKEKIFRGKVDVYISCENLSVDVHDIRYNAPVAKVYYQYIKQISEEFDLPMNLSASRLSMFSDVITQEETKENEEALTDALFDALRLAIDQFVEARTVEGSALKDDLIGKLTDMEGYVDTIEKKYPAIIEALKRRHLMYNSELERLYELEREGRVFLFMMSEDLSVSVYTKDSKPLLDVYDLGLKDYETKKEELKKFLSE